VKRLVLVTGLAVCAASSALGQSYNLYGGTGLIDLPSAEAQPDGQLGFNFSGFGQTERAAFSFQALPGLHGNVIFAETPEAGGTRADTILDLQFRLVKEDGLRPAVALGLRDILGDGIYGAEYLVATKTVVPGLKVTGGLGWGRLATDGGFANPFGRDTRMALRSPSGQLQTRTFFTGDAALFGGLEWETPVRGLTFKAEYSTDNYDPEQAGGFERSSPFNFGLSYAFNENIALSAHYLYGSTVGAQLTLTGNPNNPIQPQDLGQGPVPVRARAADASRSTAWASSGATRQKMTEALAEVLAAEGIVIQEAKISGTEIDLYIINSRISREPKAIGRVARVLTLAMPASVETFRITPVSGGLPTSTAVIRRSDVEKQVDRPDAGLMSWQTTMLEDALPHIPGDAVWTRPVSPRFSWAISPSIPVDLLDADDGIRADALVRASAKYRLTRNLSVSGQISRWAVGNDQATTFTPTPGVPTVRSDRNLYFSGRDVELDRLTADYVFKATPTIYGRVSGGYFERMYAGVSGEVLWKPTDSPIALGAELNYAKKRNFDDAFSLADYDTVTGHASLYWDTGIRGLEAQFDVGRYLAGDWGATASLSRRFANGWDVRAFLTRTEISPSQFGDGAFTKGISITMPLRWGLPFESKSTASLSLIRDTGDGGARLGVPDRLHSKVRDYDRASLRQNWSSFWQ